jgi:hypothetical protein
LARKEAAVQTRSDHGAERRRWYSVRGEQATDWLKDFARIVPQASADNPAPGTPGTCGRNSGRLRGLAQWDLSVLKKLWM